MQGGHICPPCLTSTAIIYAKKNGPYVVYKPFFFVEPSLALGEVLSNLSEDFRLKISWYKSNPSLCTIHY